MSVDPTLAAIDEAMEQEAALQPPRAYLGMSGIAHPCERKLWFEFRWIAQSIFPAETLKKFADGHMGEDLQAKRLRMVPGLTLITHTEDGQQLGFSDIGGHFRGHMDGELIGLIQDPTNTYVWEHKQVAPAKQKELQKLIDTHGEGRALEKWNDIYYGQATLYMEYGDYQGHYLTVSDAGGRATISVITQPNKEHANTLIQKAERIIDTKEVPAKMPSASPAWWLCKFCSFFDNCFNNKPALQTCRSCKYAEPIDGGWQCNLHQKSLTISEQDHGCSHYHSVL